MRKKRKASGPVPWYKWAKERHFDSPQSMLDVMLNDRKLTVAAVARLFGVYTESVIRAMKRYDVKQQQHEHVKSGVELLSDMISELGFESEEELLRELIEKRRISLRVLQGALLCSREELAEKIKFYGFIPPQHGGVRSHFTRGELQKRKEKEENERKRKERKQKEQEERDAKRRERQEKKGYPQLYNSSRAILPEGAGMLLRRVKKYEETHSERIVRKNNE